MKDNAAPHVSDAGPDYGEGGESQQDTAETQRHEKRRRLRIIRHCRRSVNAASGCAPGRRLRKPAARVSSERKVGSAATRLRAAGTSGPELLAGTASRAGVAQAVLELIEVAERYYASAEIGLRLIPWRSRLAILVASRVYRAIGLRLRSRGGEALAGRTVVPGPWKAVWTAAALLGFARGVIWPSFESHDPGLHRDIADLPGADRGRAGGTSRAPGSRVSV